jgi:hypothetical protein
MSIQEALNNFMMDLYQTGVTKITERVEVTLQDAAFLSLCSELGARSPYRSPGYGDEVELYVATGTVIVKRARRPVKTGSLSHGLRLYLDGVARWAKPPT